MEFIFFNYIRNKLKKVTKIKKPLNLCGFILLHLRRKK